MNGYPFCSWRAHASLSFVKQQPKWKKSNDHTKSGIDSLSAVMGPVKEQSKAAFQTLPVNVPLLMKSAVITH